MVAKSQSADVDPGAETARLRRLVGRLEGVRDRMAEELAEAEERVAELECARIDGWQSNRLISAWRALARGRLDDASYEIETLLADLDPAWRTRA